MKDKWLRHFVMSKY